MGNERIGIIDAIFTGNDSRVVMAIWNPRGWSFETFLELQTRVNAYLSSDYVRLFRDTYTNRFTRKLEIRLISRYEPGYDSVVFLNRIKSFLEVQDLTFSYQVSPSFKSAIYQNAASNLEFDVVINPENSIPDAYRPAKRVQATSPPQYYVYHCFISYTTREEEVQQIKPFIDEFIGELQSRGVWVCPVFYDGFYLRSPFYSDEELRLYLRHAIQRSAFMIAFLSPGYYDSRWCQFEIEENSLEHDKRGVPAQKWSLLPIEWKDSDGSRQFSDYAYFIRFSELSNAMPECLHAVASYLAQWYPEMGWDFSYRY